MKNSTLSFIKLKMIPVLVTTVITIAGCTENNGTGMLVVTDYIKADGKTDVADKLQELIDNNPNRTLYFPDGTFLLSHSILTPAHPSKSVHLVLSNYAIIKASDNWQGDALVRLGGKDFFEEIIDGFIYIDGSNFGIEGGIFDGNGIADGIAVDTGREIYINHVSIKHTQIGLHIRKDPRYGSSDSDFSNINIVGNDKPNSIGVLIEGYDNTLTNMRIASINTGVWCKSGGNSMKNIHPLYIFHPDQDYASSTGFIIEEDNNFLDYCYSDQFASGFKLGRGVCANLTDCFAWWYRGDVPSQIAIVCDGPLESHICGFHAGFCPETPEAAILLGEKGGKGSYNGYVVRDHKLKKEDLSEYYLTR